MAELLIPTLLYRLPVGGAACTVLKLLYKQLLELLRKRKIKTAIIWDYLKSFGMAIVSIWGLAIFGI